MFFKKGLLLLYILLCIQTVHALDLKEVVNTGMGKAESVVAPPLPPEEDSIENEQHVLEFILIDVNTKEQISDTHVLVNYEEQATKKSRRTLQYVPKNGTLTLQLDPGTYDFVFLIDLLETEGKDYFYETTQHINANRNENILFFPIGGVMGTVTKEGEVIPGADVKFTCSKEYGDISSVKTDEFGSFVKYALPTGSCTIYIRGDSKVGQEKVTITQGGMQTTKIEFTHDVSTSNTMLIVLIILLGYILLQSGYLLFKYQKKTKKELTSHAKNSEEKRDHKPGSSPNSLVKNPEPAQHKEKTKLDDIAKTLNEREREIITCLAEKGSRTQGELIHMLRIPKTSIARTLDHMEQKQLITIERFGKMKRIILQKWLSDHS